MNPAMLLIAELRLLDVELVVDGENLRYQGPKGAVTPEHIQRLKSLKSEIRDRLIAEEDALSWRVDVMLASDPPTFWVLQLPPKPGQCWSCQEPQPLNQDGKCTLCCLASVRVSRIVDGIDPQVDEETQAERDMYISQQALMEIAS